MKLKWFGAGLLAVLLVPPAWADDPPKPAVKTYAVPYRLTKVQHILVRAKINGKGPFNLIIDTGAPALFLTTATARKLEVKPDDKGWGTFDRFELEGGVVIEKARGRIEDLFQLDGMNGMGLAGAELHGIIGYNILARYRLELDLTKDKLGLTPLDFKPPAPLGLNGKAGTNELDAMAGLVKILAKLMGKRPQPVETPRGFLGIEIAGEKDEVSVKSVLAKSPAATAGIKAGDRITHLQGEAVKGVADVGKLNDKLAAGDSVKLTVVRGSEKIEMTIKAGEGF